ncbi:zinc ribbon domain-containing protein [Flavobacterium sp. LB3P45]|uniref:Zinc ribbon domain-containing protein n=1 Tax=Flavobacterium fructosi TaxID=3230416 RepID=A0ABW6HNW3_9FLAO
MENIILCQSCGLPLGNEEIKGKEKNGLKNDLYCKYCYEDGMFTKPNMTIEDMKDIVSTQMKKLKLPIYTIQKAINILPSLSRWKNK